MKWEWFVEDICNTKDSECNLHVTSQTVFIKDIKNIECIDIKEINSLCTVFNVKELRTLNEGSYDKNHDYYSIHN